MAYRGTVKPQKSTTLQGFGTIQATATQLVYTTSNVEATVGDTAVILPVGFAGAQLFIVSVPGGQNILLFPRTGNTVNGGAANASVTIVNTARVTTAVCIDGGNWIAGPLA